MTMNYSDLLKTVADLEQQNSALRKENHTLHKELENKHISLRTVMELLNRHFQRFGYTIVDNDLAVIRDLPKTLLDND